MTGKWKEDFERTVAAVAAGGPSLGLSIAPEVARASMITQWMRQGDFRPLAEAIAEGQQPLDPAIGRALMRLIDEGRVCVKPKSGKRGAPDRPGLLARKSRMFEAYHEELERGATSDDAFEKVARDFTRSEGVSISPGTVRRAVTDMHKLTDNKWKRERAPNPDLIGMKGS